MLQNHHRLRPTGIRSRVYERIVIIFEDFLTLSYRVIISPVETAGNIETETVHMILGDEIAEAAGHIVAHKPVSVIHVLEDFIAGRGNLVEPWIFSRDIVCLRVPEKFGHGGVSCHVVVHNIDEYSHSQAMACIYKFLVLFPCAVGLVQGKM